MQTPEFFEKLTRALRAEGITTRGEKQLSAEYYDHYTCGLETRLEQGMAPADASAASIAALGDPRYLAQAAAEKWRTKLWSNRHPWLFGLLNGIGAYLLGLLFVVTAACTADFLRGGGWLSPHSPKVALIFLLGTLSNWLPPLLGGLWMGWGYRTKRCRLKTFWIGCVGVALGASLFCVEVVAPTLEHHGYMTVNAGPLVIALFWLVAPLNDQIARLGGDITTAHLGARHWKPLLGSTTMWLQLLLTFAFAWAINIFRPAFTRRGISG